MSVPGISLACETRSAERTCDSHASEDAAPQAFDAIASNERHAVAQDHTKAPAVTALLGSGLHQSAT